MLNLASGQAEFCTTLWSVVRSAGGENGATSMDAASELCRRYWHPLYAFSRRHGATPEDASDLVQGFFGHVFATNVFGAAEPSEGRFRTFLLACFRNYCGQQHVKARARKRGGGVEHLPLDFNEAESIYQLTPSTSQSADNLFDRQWAVALVERVLNQMEAEATALGKKQLFSAVLPFLTGDAVDRYATIGTELGLSEGALRVAVHRMRLRFKTLFRQEIAETVRSPKDLDEEFHAVLRILSSS